MEQNKVFLGNVLYVVYILIILENKNKNKSFQNMDQKILIPRSFTTS